VALEIAISPLLKGSSLSLISTTYLLLFLLQAKTSGKIFIINISTKKGRCDGTYL
jgi:hypothetical protein